MWIIDYVRAYGWKPNWSASSQGWLSREIYMKRETNGVDGISDSSRGVYPNPAIGNVTVSETAPILWIKIYALTGAEVMSQDCSGSESSADIDVSALPSGHYILVSATVSGIQRHRLIKR
ncbi:MAG: T9SS type A sorting domain-containing protein, partial [Muribaculaceae bacterium]|nr:T9SS type A sorting domain-containing protein [Muribaculaceae bacterium]